MPTESLATVAKTLGDQLDRALPDRVADALRQLDLNRMFTKRDSTVAGTGVATITLAPPALLVQSVRVAGAGGAGEAANGVRTAVADPGGAAGAATCLINAAGDTLTFEGNIPAAGSARVVYLAQPETALTADFDRS